MKTHITIILFILTLYSCITFGQLSTFFVKPYQTDIAYPTTGDSNYVAINESVTPLNKLLFYIGGTNSSPKRTTLFLNLAANLGYNVISVTYPNSTAIQSACGASSDLNCYNNFRQEVCYGTPLSSSISIDTLNSLNTRAIKLLQYLIITYPSQNWGQFIVGNSINWNKVVTSGHSQGAGNALYFASVNTIERCIMFSGANDFSNFFNAAPNWISGSFATVKSNIFSFLHLQDDVVPYSDQIQVTQALGLWTGGDDSTLVDNLTIPYNNSHLLYTNETPQSMLITPFHNATVIDYWTPLDDLSVPKFISVWTYLLTSTITSSKTEISKNENIISVYPNPVNDILTLINLGSTSITINIFNSLGLIVNHTKISNGKNLIDISNLDKGVYFIISGSTNLNFIKQ